jgi:CheY-like chemotaxis protein
MPDGGTLTIAAFNDAAADAAVLSVRDTGLGMDEATKGRLFDRFYTTKAGNTGTGLGLTTVASIVRTAGGRIEVDSAPGQGSLFRITLPRAHAVPDAARADDDDADLHGQETVLVVDDESGAAAMAARALLDYGYSVVEASGPGAAMLAFAQRTTPVDLVVTDLVMPELNGRALVQQLRVHQPELAVLYISGHAEQLVGDAQGAAGDAPVIAKPFTPEQLARAVRRVLRDRDRERDAPGEAPRDASAPAPRTNGHSG